MCAGSVVNAIAAPTRGFSLQSNELCSQPWKIEEYDITAVENREYVLVYVALAVIRGDVLDPMFTKLLPWPFPGIAIPRDVGDIIRLQKRG